MARPDHPSDPVKRRGQLAGGPFAYSREGKSRGDGSVPYLLLHGLPGSARDFRWLAPALGAHGDVIRIDMPGFGDTPARTAPGLDVPARAQFVLDVMDALALDRPILVGHSMGGVVAAAAAAEAPGRLAGLVLLASPGLRVHQALRRAPLRTVGKVLDSPLLRLALRRPIRRFFRAAGFRHGRDDERARTLRILRATSMADHVAALAKVRRAGLPVAHAYSEDDPMIEAAIMADTADALGGPVFRFADGGHNPQKHHAVEIADGLAAWGARAGSR